MWLGNQDSSRNFGCHSIDFLLLALLTERWKLLKKQEGCLFHMSRACRTENNQHGTWKTKVQGPSDDDTLSGPYQ
jgi:hypothetical protein